MNDEVQTEWPTDHPINFCKILSCPICLIEVAIDPRLLELDKNRAKINPDLNEGSGGEGWPAGVQQGSQSHANQAGPHAMLRPDSEPLEHTNPMTGHFPDDWPSSDNDTSIYTGKESQTFPSSSVNLSEPQKDNLLDNPIFQSYVHTARGTPQSPSPGPQSSNAKGDGPLTLDHPIVKGYLKLVPHLQHIIKHLIDAQWYKESSQEPPGKELPMDLGLKTRQSSSTPMSLFGAFFSARQPYDCLLCPEDSPKHKHKRTLERALGHSREHFNFKPIEANRKMYTNLNTKNDQERRAKKPAKFCIPCGKKRITVQNCQRHLQSNAHKASAASYSEDQSIWSDTQ